MVLLACVLGTTVRAQVDPHFSQYYIQPMTMNPAFTGAFDGDYRVSGIFRSQYGNTLNTEGISAEKTTNKNANLGFNLINQTSNDGAYSFTNGYLTFAYTGVRFGKNADHYLVMAMQMGFISRKFDITKMSFGSQWVSGIGYDASNPSNETFLKPQVTSFDAGAGIAYYDATPNKTATFSEAFLHIILRNLIIRIYRIRHNPNWISGIVCRPVCVSPHPTWFRLSRRRYI